MKKIKQKSVRFALPMLTLLISLNSGAQTQLAESEGGHSGNGGDPNELSEFSGKNHERLDSWYSVKQDLMNGFLKDKYLELDLKGQNGSVFKARVLQALMETPVEFKAEWIKINDVDRPCKNFLDEKLMKRIQCNPVQYVSAMQNYAADEQYKLIAHEYLSVAGFEPNRYGLSDYPFSSQISTSLNFVLTKRWSLLGQTAKSALIERIERVSRTFKRINSCPVKLFGHAYAVEKQCESMLVDIGMRIINETPELNRYETEITKAYNRHSTQDGTQQDEECSYGRVYRYPLIDKFSVDFREAGVQMGIKRVVSILNALRDAQ